MHHIPRTLLIIVGGALLIRIGLCGLILWNFGENSFFGGDSPRFYRPAINLLAGNGFSQSTEPPFVAHADFPPIYSFVIAGSLLVGNSLVPLIVLQIILSSFLPVIVWGIAGFISDSSRLKTSSAALTAFEPQMILWSLFLITEVTAIFFLFLAIYFFLKIFSHQGSYSALWSGLFLGLSTLVRPHAQFLVILGAGFLIFGAWKNRQGFPLKISILFACAFFAVLAPWLIRNWYNFNTISVSTTGLRNIYSGVGTSVISYKTGEPYNDVQENLHEQIYQKYGFTEKDIHENPAIGRVLAKEGMKIVLENPVSSIGAFAVILNSFFTQDLYLDYARRFGLIPHFSFGFSPSLVIMKEGPLVLISLIQERIGWYAIIPVAGRVFWISLNILWILGAYAAFRSGGKLRVIACIFTVLIIYYALLNTVAGFSDQGRLRYAVNPLMFILASFGLTEFIRFLRNFSLVIPRSLLRG